MSTVFSIVLNSCDLISDSRDEGVPSGTQAVRLHEPEVERYQRLRALTIALQQYRGGQSHLLQNFHGVVDFTVRSPLIRMVAIIEIAKEGGHRGGAGTTTRFDITLGITNIEALLGLHPTSRQAYRIGSG